MGYSSFIMSEEGTQVSWMMILEYLTLVAIYKTPKLSDNKLQKKYKYNHLLFLAYIKICQNYSSLTVKHFVRSQFSSKFVQREDAQMNTEIVHNLVERKN